MGRNEWGIPTGETYVTPMTKIETPQIGLYFLESKQKEGLARPAASRTLSDALFTITIPLSTHCPSSPLLVSQLQWPSDVLTYPLSLSCHWGVPSGPICVFGTLYPSLEQYIENNRSSIKFFKKWMDEVTQKVNASQKKKIKENFL